MSHISDAIYRLTLMSEGSQHDINHFLKVWAYAKTIGEQEGLDARTQETLELAAIVHDIACPDLRKEHGSTPGNLQEEYGVPLTCAFFQNSDLDEEMLDRICFLVGHHHTFKDVDGIDYQILLEADFLVNAGESEKYHKAIPKYRENVFKTETGIALLESVYGKRQIITF